MSADAALLLATQAAQLPFEALPAAALQAARNDILDTLGVAIAGVDTPGCRELIATLREAYSGTQAGILCSGLRTSAPEAALANATLAHALDFDDTHDKAFLHAGISVVPAALAIAEHSGRPVSGREFLAAVSLGIDWICRMGLASRLAPVASGWMYTSVYGYFGATAACARVLGLDAERTLAAIGIAYAQAAGNMQCIVDGSLTKRMQPGFAARAGVLSALLAQNGIAGARNVLDGEAGLYRVYLRDAYDRERLLHGLGSHFEGVNLSFKLYPSCRYTHTAIDAALDLVQGNPIDPDSVERITVGLNQHAYKNVCTPRPVRIRPQTVVDAQFSIPYCVAVAISAKEVLIPDFSLQRIADPALLALAAKVHPEVDPAIEQSHAGQMSPALVQIRLTDGRCFTARRDVPRGSPEDPMDYAELAAKFRRCVAASARPPAAPAVEELVALIAALETIPDVRVIARLLA